MARHGFATYRGCWCRRTRRSPALAEGKSVTISNRRRIVRRAVMAVAAFVLLPVGYVALWLAVSAAAGNGLIGEGVARSLRPVFLPLILYCDDMSRPGACRLSELWWRTNPLRTRRGNGVTYHDYTSAHVFAPEDLMDVHWEAIER
jgi:hypothetical protein